jgi:hypothetical protein
MNFHRTVDSRKVSGKSLEDEGATKDPLPLLRIIRCILEKGAWVAHLFVVMISVHI